MELERFLQESALTPLNHSKNSAVLLVTGATGFLGGATVVHLLASGFSGRIVALVRGEDEAHCRQRLCGSLQRFEPDWGNRLPANLEVVKGDLTEEGWGYDSKLEGLTHVLHVAANTSFGRSRDVRKTNVEGSLAVVHEVRRHKLTRYVHVGTAHIAGLEGPPLVFENEHPDPDVNHLVPYTASKAEAETELLKCVGDLPLVIARPSIVVGHTKLGCKPSGSIFWVCRAVEQLRMITWDPENQLDVIPVDYAAVALAHLIFAPQLKHCRYHISAGSGSISWREVGNEFARLRGGPTEDRYRQVDFSEISASDNYLADAGKQNRQMLKALELYYKFCGVSKTFDNTRLLAEGVPLPPPVSAFLGPCLVTSSKSIYDQMLSDF